MLGVLFQSYWATWDVTSLKPKLRDKIQNGKPGFKARMLHCSCCMHIQLHSGVNSIHSHESLSYIVQAVAAIATDFLTPVNWPITALQSNLIVLSLFIQNGQKAIDIVRALEASMFVKNCSDRPCIYFWYTIIVDVKMYYQYFFIYENFALYFKSWMQGQHK